MNGYNPALSWLNAQDPRILRSLYREAYRETPLRDVQALTLDAVKGGLLRWAEGRDGVPSLAGLEAA